MKQITLFTSELQLLIRTILPTFTRVGFNMASFLLSILFIIDVQVILNAFLFVSAKLSTQLVCNPIFLLRMCVNESKVL